MKLLLMHALCEEYCKQALRLVLYNSGCYDFVCFTGLMKPMPCQPDSRALLERQTGLKTLLIISHFKTRVFMLPALALGLLDVPSLLTLQYMCDLKG